MDKILYTENNIIVWEYCKNTIVNSLSIMKQTKTYYDIEIVESTLLYIIQRNVAELSMIMITHMRSKRTITIPSTNKLSWLGYLTQSLLFYSYD